MTYTDLSRKVQEHVLAYFQSHEDPTFVYHNLVHTQGVVKAAIQIANYYRLEEKELFIVTTAAWFHDAGYFEDYTQHERRGVEKAVSFLQKIGVDQETIDAVRGCILATMMPQRPNNKLEQIVCDADLFHFGTEEFPERNKLMRKEVEIKKGTSISKEEWRLGTIRLLEAHHYFTDYAIALLSEKEKEHLDNLRRKASKKSDSASPAIKTKDSSVTTPILSVAATGSSVESAKLTLPEEIIPKKKKEDKSSRPDRGIETMFRITSANNQRLSDMADNKAHIMITVNSIILSAVISLLLRKLEEYSYLAWPTYLILTISVSTIIFSILATRPNLPAGLFTQKDIEEKRVNLLFFGNFYRMSLTDYTAGMLQVMGDRDFLYGSLIKDVYSQGVVLGRKYRLLRISYNIFMYGLIISVLAFVLASIIAGK